MPDERDSIDAELIAALGPSDPEALFQLGRAVPNAATAAEALTVVHPHVPSDYLPQFDPKAPFTGVTITDLAELDAVINEQETAQPTHRNPDRLRWSKGLRKVVTRFWWASLGDYDRHPLKLAFKDITGQGEPWSEREAPVTAFLRALPHLHAPDWVEAIIFAESPYPKMWPPPYVPGKPHMPDTKGVVDHRPQVPIQLTSLPPIEMPHTRWRIAYLRRDMEGPPQLPDWLLPFLEAAESET